MDAAVLIAGLSVYLVATVIYLRGAYQVGPLWCWSSFVLPPIALVFYTLYWRRSWRLFTLHTAGLALLAMGVVMFVRANPTALTNTPLSGLQRSFAPASLERPLDSAVNLFADSQSISPFIGRIDGVIGGTIREQKTLIDEVELDSGVLRFKQGAGLFPAKEIAIFLGITEYDVDGSWELTINPTTQPSPIIHVMSYNERTKQVETDVYDGGYWLELTLSDRRLNQLSGFVKLMLPGDQRDFIAGNFESYTSQLRYEDGEVNRFYDSKDTIEYVANLHLETRFQKAVHDVRFLETSYLAKIANPVGQAISELKLSDGSIHTIGLNLFKGEQGWTVDTHSTDDLQVAINTLVAKPPAAGKPSIVSVQTVYQGKDYATLLGKELQVTSKSGSVRVGRLKTIENTQLVLNQKVENGFMDIHVPKRQVEEVLVLN
ncbi:MAG: hypothetical protein MI867_05970 [Pseudomonadales bacterium]|nr:hypothetical protein [Pseudomonadales bacterium]